MACPQFETTSIPTKTHLVEDKGLHRNLRASPKEVGTDLRSCWGDLYDWEDRKVRPGDYSVTMGTEVGVFQSWEQSHK